MPRKKQSRGTCGFCGREMTRSGLSKHLHSCPQRQEAITLANNTQTTMAQPIYHLLVQDAYNSDFWLQLEVNGFATLKDVDKYLRAIWLECCGHLSRFSVGGWRTDEIPKRRKIEQVFSHQTELTHIYDFGTSSKTQLKRIATRRGNPLTKHPIYLMARNKMPTDTCAECDAVAGWYCADCLVNHGEWITLCQAHLSHHSHDVYGGVTPLFNSPRLGVCGYDGPATPPY